MTREELHAIIRQAFLAEYGQHAVPAGDARFAAGADHAAGAIVEAMQAIDAGEPEDERRRRLAGHEPAPLEALRRNVARCIEEGAPTIEAMPASDPLPWPTEATMDRERITSLAAETARHEAGIGALGTVLANHSRTLDDLGARISAVEHLTHNTTELARELTELRNITRRHRTELDYIAGETDTLPPADDPDQRLGGHDNPHHQHSHFPTPADSDSA